MPALCGAPVGGMRDWTFMDNAVEIEQKLELTYAAFRSSRASSFESRGEKWRGAAEILACESSRFAEIMTAEMGKTIQSAKVQCGDRGRAGICERNNVFASSNAIWRNQTLRNRA